MSRYISFRDFDWLLFIFVLLICGLGVMEIRSATAHTKFAGAHIRQLYWIAGGVAGMFLMSLVNYQKLLDRVHWMYIAAIVSLMTRDDLRAEISGCAALDQDARWRTFSALRMGQADPDSGRGQVLCRLAPERAFLAGLHQGGRDCAECPCFMVLAQPDLGTGLDLPPDRGHGALPGWSSLEAGC